MRSKRVSHTNFPQGKEQARKSSKASKNNKHLKKGATVRSSTGVAGNFVRMTDLRNNILFFRDLLDLPPCVATASVSEVGTLHSFHLLYFSACNLKKKEKRANFLTLLFSSNGTFLQLLIWTLKDLHKLYANVRPNISISELERSSKNQVKNVSRSLLDVLSLSIYMSNKLYDSCLLHIYYT